MADIKPDLMKVMVLYFDGNEYGVQIMSVDESKIGSNNPKDFILSSNVDVVLTLSNPGFDQIFIEGEEVEWDDPPVQLQN